MSKILIVDDSLLERKLLINTLTKSGIQNEILQAVNGQEGLEKLSQHYQDICLILLDWQMPQVDGLEFMTASVKVPKTANIPIIMITASGSDDSRKQAYETNPNLAGYVVKPYKPQELIDLIQPYINR